MSDQVDPSRVVEERAPQNQEKPDGKKTHRWSWMLDAFSTREEHTAILTNEKMWAKAGKDLDPDGPLWRQYEVLVNLYQYYLEVAWKVAVWYYATTGLVLAYYFNNIDDSATLHTYLPFLLIFIAIISIGFGYLTWRGAYDLNAVPRWLNYIAVQLKLPGRPHVEFAVVFLIINGLMMFAVALSCVILIVLSKV